MLTLHNDLHSMNNGEYMTYFSAKILKAMPQNCIELFKFSLSVCWEFLSIQVHKPDDFGFTNWDIHSTSLAQFLNRPERFPKRWYVHRPDALASVVTLQLRQEHLHFQLWIYWMVFPFHFSKPDFRNLHSIHVWIWTPTEAYSRLSILSVCDIKIEETGHGSDTHKGIGVLWSLSSGCSWNGF